MTMNWGTKIALLYIGFVLMIVFMVFKSNNEKVDLVSADYYAQELKFQDKIDGQKNTNTLSTPIECEAANKTVNIKFPSEFNSSKTSGEIYFYRPSDASLDLNTSLKLDAQGNQEITNPKFERGIYRMQIKASIEGKAYYFEQQIFMN